MYVYNAYMLILGMGLTGIVCIWEVCGSVGLDVEICGDEISTWIYVGICGDMGTST